MKKIILLAITAVIVTNIFAQQPEDALRYSWLTQSGTARNQAIGGASASLGGEFSTLFINPAGLGFYKNDELVLTPAYMMQKNKGTYKNNLSTTTDNIFNFGASGFIFSFPSYPKSEVRNFTVGFGINRTADFNDYIYYKGTNNKTSYSEKYLEELVHNNVTDPNNAANNFPNGSSLAFNTYLIDTFKINGAFAGYKTLANPATGLLQENTINTSGGMTDFALGGAVNVKDKVFFGGSFTLSLLNYNSNSHFKESDATASTTNNFNYFTVDEMLQTKGVGANAKLGIIYKPQEYVRLGLTIHSPTFYDLTDKFSTDVTTDLEGYGGAGVKHQSSTVFNNGAPFEGKYNYSSAWRVIAGGSYVFREVENVKRQKAFISADIEYVNYRSARFNAQDANDIDAKNYYADLNSVIKDQYKGALNVRLGGELKFNTLMVRLGGAYYGDPYKNESANKIKLAGGLGYRNKGFFVDLTYVYAMNKDVNYPYRLQDKASDPAVVKDNVGNIVATVGFKL